MTCNDMAEVTICIPTYNGALYLEQCLDSAVRQRFADIEIVVVDDCSTDDTCAIVRRVAERDRRVRLICNSARLGLVRNWNRCLQYATGKWVKFLFQDDFLTEKCVEMMLNAAEAHRGNKPHGFVVCEREFVIEEGVSQELRHFYENSVIRLHDVFPGKTHILPEELSEAILVKGAGCNFIGEPTSVMIRRGLCFQHSFFNQNLLHLCDLEYWTRLGTNEGLAYLPDRLAVFRVHNRSASAYNHAHHHFELEYLDKIILLHDYLYHPSYFNLRKPADAETVLSHQLENQFMKLANRGGASDRQDKEMLLNGLAEKYPILRRVDEPIPKTATR